MRVRDVNAHEHEGDSYGVYFGLTRFGNSCFYSFIVCFNVTWLAVHTILSSTAHHPDKLPNFQAVDKVIIPIMEYPPVPSPDRHRS